jgi:putative membrane protein
MDFWCSSTRRVWTWTPRPYLGAIVIVLGVVAVALWWRARGRATTSADYTGHDVQTEVEGSSVGRSLALVFGALGLWAVLDWPLASLGAGYLASAQMIRQIVMVMLVAPLLLFAVPPALAVRVIGWGKALTVLRITARPAFAIPVAAGLLLLVNTPALADPLLPTQYGSFLMDLMWIIAGFALWMPVQCPHPGVRRLTGGAALAYLIAQSIVPVLPGFFMTWADYPVFSVYELAPRVFTGFDAVNDQQTAAAILQVGGMVLLWLQLSYRFISWGNRQMEENRAAQQAMRRAAGTAGPAA